LVTDQSAWGSYDIIAPGGRTNAGVVIDGIHLHLSDSSGHALSSTALAQPLDVAKFTMHRDLVILGRSLSGNGYFSIFATIREIRHDVAPEFAVLPADGDFLPTQRFDYRSLANVAALRAPGGARRAPPPSSTERLVKSRQARPARTAPA
jgi:hypothetical protein